MNRLSSILARTPTALALLGLWFINHSANEVLLYGGGYIFGVWTGSAIVAAGFLLERRRSIRLNAALTAKQDGS